MEQMCQRTQARTGTVGVRDFQTIKVIGKGSYGKVLLVKKKDKFSTDTLHLRGEAPHFFAALYLKIFTFQNLNFC